MATHGLFSGESMQILRANSNFIHKIVITNTIPQTKSKDELKDMVHVIDVSGKFNVFENHYTIIYLEFVPNIFFLPP